MLSSKEVFREELVLLNYEAKSTDDALRALAAKLYEDGAVKETYCDAMLEREEAYPTGLPIEGDIKVAIPHADVEHVNYSAFAIAILNNPVKFGEMGAAPDSLLDVQIIMMLANADPDEQVKTLRKMVDLFDEPASLQSIISATAAAEVVGILRNGYQ